MASPSALDKRAHEIIRRSGRISLLVGVPSYNNAGTISHVARVAAEGVEKYFPGLPALLLNSDGGSGDGTAEKFLSSPVPESVQKLSTRYVGIPGKGTALKAIFEAAVAAGAQACVVIDSDLRSITPEWMHLLARPIIEGQAGYITPLYLRHKYDGTITNSLAYPLTRALYGKRVRQPIGGDFGVSAALVREFLEEDVWQTAAAQFGIDIFMTTTAISKGATIVQANLGTKIHDAKDPAAHLGPMFRQVVGTMFSLMRRHQSAWLNTTQSHPVPAVGSPLEQEPEPVPVNLTALVQQCKDGIAGLSPFWATFLSQDALDAVQAMGSLDESAFSFPPKLWVKLAYQFAVAYNSRTLNPEEVVDSLAPLYFGRTAAFVKETETITSAQAEQVIERLAELFESEKHQLIRLWSTI
jgi:hypothetical protein